MTRFVVDPSVAIELARTRTAVAAQHRLLAPTLLRSQVLSSLHAAAQRGELTIAEARESVARVRALPIRLLGDSVLQRRAWDLADRLGWAETYTAEYIALTQLQADAFITLDPELARAAARLVEVAPMDALR